MKKYIALSLLVAVIFGVGGVSPVFVKKAEAATVTAMNLLKSVSILGISVIPSGGSKFTMVDMDNEPEEHYVVTLPTLDGNNGLLYIVKRPLADSPYAIIVQAASGDLIDAGALSDAVLDENGEYVQLVADTTNGTWWVVGFGVIAY